MLSWKTAGQGGRNTILRGNDMCVIVIKQISATAKTAQRQNSSAPNRQIAGTKPSLPQQRRQIVTFRSRPLIDLCAAKQSTKNLLFLKPARLYVVVQLVWRWCRFCVWRLQGAADKHVYECLKHLGLSVLSLNIPCNLWKTNYGLAVFFSVNVIGTEEKKVKVREARLWCN